jgi:hypothetical protein
MDYFRSDDDDDDDDDEPEHSGIGIASFVITCAAGLLEFVMLAYAGFLETVTPGGINEDSTEAMVIGLVMFGGLAVDLVGIGLGFAGLFQSHHRKTFPVLGIVIGAVVLIGVVGVIAVGMMME